MVDARGRKRLGDAEADAAAAESRIAFEVWRAYQTVEAETSAVAASAELVKGTQEAFAAARRSAPARPVRARRPTGS